jgi:hypothetical protein
MPRVVAVGDVADDGGDVDAALRELLPRALELRFIACGEGDAGAFPPELTREEQTEAARPGDHDGSVAKSMARPVRRPRASRAAPMVNAPAASAVSCALVMPQRRARPVPLSRSP